jgi:multiple sugar transport system substrate-binding protein
VKKRAFVRRLLSAAAVTGLVATGSITAAQQTARAAGPVTLIFWNGPDTTGTVPTLIKNFNAMEKGKIKVVLQTQSATTDNYFTTLQRGLHAGSTTPDVFAGDVIWPAQLAGQNLILPVDKYFSKSAQSKYIPGTIQDVQYKGHAYGAPWFTDFGMIYYRKDLLQKYHMAVPTTWEQLQSEAKTLVAKKAVKEGFVFQGAQYEGLVCDALEYIRGAGGYVYPVSQANSTQSKAAQGLQTMASMITSGASPKAVTTYQESQTNNDFVDGLAAFGRNWPYMWANAQAKGSKVIGKVGVTNMLHEPGQKGYSTLGGWWLGINKNSKNPDASWAFINYLIGMSAQQYWAIHGGHAVALVAANKSDTVVKALPWLPSVTANLNLVPRPTSPVYNDISLEMQKDFHGVLAGSMSAAAAIKSTDSFIQMAEARFK